MAHYARTTPPVRPPERPPLPDQYWVAWWEDVPDETFVDPLAPNSEGGRLVDQESGRGSDPDGIQDRGGLRRIGVPPPGAPVPPSDDPYRDHSPDPERPAVSHWSLLETAATATAPAMFGMARGSFTLEGVAHRGGDLVFAGVTFPEPIRPAPRPDQIRLTFSDRANVGPAGVQVAELDGFTPDELGFTLIATSLNPGALWVDGHYDVER